MCLVLNVEGQPNITILTIASITNVNFVTQDFSIAVVLSVQLQIFISLKNLWDLQGHVQIINANQHISCLAV